MRFSTGVKSLERDTDLNKMTLERDPVLEFSPVNV
jgi:hypothetical protein